MPGMEPATSWSHYLKLHVIQYVQSLGVQNILFGHNKDTACQGCNVLQSQRAICTEFTSHSLSICQTLCMCIMHLMQTDRWQVDSVKSDKEGRAGQVTPNQLLLFLLNLSFTIKLLFFLTVAYLRDCGLIWMQFQVRTSTSSQMKSRGFFFFFWDFQNFFSPTLIFKFFSLPFHVFTFLIHLLNMWTSWVCKWGVWRAPQ